MTIRPSSQLPPKIIKLKQTGTQHSLTHTHTYIYISSFSNLVYSNSKQKISTKQNRDLLELHTCMNKNGILQQLHRKKNFFAQKKNLNLVFLLFICQLLPSSFCK